MGRPSKAIEAVDDVVLETPVVKEIKVEAPKKTYSISASFKTRTQDGDRITHKYLGAGTSVEEAVETVAGNDDDLVDEYNKPFPKGINMLVNCTIRTQGYEYSRALAPHVARDIFENKNVLLAKKLFGV